MNESSDLESEAQTVCADKHGGKNNASHDANVLLFVPCLENN